MSDSEIGFHGAADVSKKTGAVSVSGSGNALLGAYLARLGFSYTLIDMLTDAEPDEMNWLDFTKAKQVGITMRVYKSAAKQAAPPPASPVVPFLKKDKADVVNIP